MIKKINLAMRWLFTCFITFFSLMAFAAAEKPVNTMPPITLESAVPDTSTSALYDLYPWAALYYYGVTGTDALGSIALQGQFHRWPEHIQSLELTKTLDRDNWFRRLVNPITDVVQIAANVTMRNGSDQSHIYEFNPYFEGRWANLPWNKYVNTSFAIGEGISYASSIPSLEGKSSEDTKRLLNYLLLEATFAPPSDPRWQVVLRIHHRSGAYGLYHAGNTGSNDIGIGVRYLFD